MDFPFTDESLNCDECHHPSIQPNGSGGVARSLWMVP
jgi:hypothetical protein